MRCGTSFYNGTLGKQLTLRFWPLIALNAVIWAIALPISGLNYMRSSHIADWATDIEYLFRVMATPMAIVFGVMAAMAVCSHLYTTRSCNFTAALPPKRTALFATHYLTGLLWLVVPVAVMTLLASRAARSKAGAVSARHRSRYRPKKALRLNTAPRWRPSFSPIRFRMVVLPLPLPPHRMVMGSNWSRGTSRLRKMPKG